MTLGRAVAGAALLGLAPARTSAEPLDRPLGERDRFELSVRGETHAELFRRALLPGANGAIVSTETIAPVRQYVQLRARDLDTPLRRDSLDVELSAWGNATIGEPGPERALDGDVQTANVTYRQDWLSVRIGRQHVAGGAARYARFDGADARAELGAGFAAEIYGGLTALPRWNQRPGYHYLGAAVDSDLRSPSALPPIERLQYWLGGGRLGYRATRVAAGLSLHDQWEQGGLSRLDLGADARAELSPVTTAAGSAILDLDARRLADARLWVDISPAALLDVSLEYLHAEPALLLSRQSVLAVFSTDGYDEIGASAIARATHELSVEGGAFAEIYDLGRPGGRGEAAVRVFAERDHRTMLRVGYARVQAPANGYHSVRTSLVRRITPRLSSSLEAYSYFYDEAIREVRTSVVYAGTLTLRPTDAITVLAGGSLARSPYALLDAQTQLRLAFDFDLVPGSAHR